ncbi:hypothetical protein KXD40_005685 [Peronospora effusa]|uniref:Uncharacterized protein n=1 Tax=Peronospora effusa TaxID=542832 RepID=A0A3M6VES3_9STRA|nr:hypothetical protein DD238_004431 [Peronospora effusa]RQM13801.1 hypothetical protein DD237_004852 [Peronospora effusa]UIZ27418.1 hypothetical protein KXD40_005685 [Peronospora effusa]CAI5727791.1 unnamed protein product [Peronospora effusa]
MGRTDDNETLRRRGRARPRPRTPNSIASMYAPADSMDSNNNHSNTSSHQTSSKMKMASLMAVVDDADESKSMRVKVDENDGWVSRNVPISISSLTTSNESLDEHITATSAASSLFQNEMPTNIQSFSEERRRESTSSRAKVNRESKNGAVHGDGTPTATRSVYDFYFPSEKMEASGGSSSAGNRSLKRKRRSGRRADDLAAKELDLLRFGVDAAKLVPQGLVDRVDVHMSHAVLVKVVNSHITNWCNRSGFAPNFLQEITTLLAAYYPCNYSTLLDEVLAGFLLKRPEFVGLLLPAMLEKMGKAGDSVSTTKYPVVDALVRMCGVRMGPNGRDCHDLVCWSLLRCLLEHNGDKFVLSPWIAACAIESSDSVLHNLWRALLYRTLSGEEKVSQDEDDHDWQIGDSTQQIAELLAEEGKLRMCRITCGFVKLLLADDDLKKQLVNSRSYLIPDCLERAFKYASPSWSSSLMTEWLERRRKQQPDGEDVAGLFTELVDFLVCSTSKLSVKKPEWFVKHILNFVLSSQLHVAEQESALRAILYNYMPFVLGGVDYQWLEQMSTQNGFRELTIVTTSVRTEGLDGVRSQSVHFVRSKIELLVGLLVAVSARTSALFFDIWSEVWADKRTTLPWEYVHALLCVSIQDIAEDQSVLVQKLQSFTTRVCRSYYRRLSCHLSKEDTYSEVAMKFSEALNLLLPSTRPVAGILLQEVLGALVRFEENHFSVASAIFGNAIILHLGSCDDGDVDISVKRSVVQKSHVEYGRFSNPLTLPNSTIVTVHVMTMLKTLASTKNETGEFTRRVLSTGRVVRLLSGLLNLGRRSRRQAMLLDVMDAVVMSNTSEILNRDWARQNVVQELVHCAYTGPSSSANRAITVVQNIFRHTTSDVQALLWVVLQQCTKLCCGRGKITYRDTPACSPDYYQGRADAFAELVKAMVVTVPNNLLRDVLRFMEQKIASCSVGKTRMNLFLLLLLRKLVVCELPCGVLLPVVQLAVCPLAPTDLDQTRLIQLQLLKALCTRLIAIRHRSVASKVFSIDADWKRYEDLVCNDRLQSDLRSMVKVTPLPVGGVSFQVERTTCNRAFEVLAQGILAFTRQLKHQSTVDEDGARRKILKRSRMK